MHCAQPDPSCKRWSVRCWVNRNSIFRRPVVKTSQRRCYRWRSASLWRQPRVARPFGSRVRIRMDGTERELRIVGDDEADPAAGLIAFSAPLARALIGAMAGEEVELPGRDEPIAVVAIL